MDVVGEKSNKYLDQMRSATTTVRYYIMFGRGTEPEEEEEEVDDVANPAMQCSGAATNTMAAAVADGGGHQRN